MILPVLAALATGGICGAAPLPERKSTASTQNNFGAGSDSDTGDWRASASVRLANGENGYASAVHNGAVKVRADSSTDDGGPGNGIVSNATQVTHYDIVSATVPQGTLVTGSVHLALHGRIQNVGNKPYGGGEISLIAILTQAMPGPDETANLFTGDLYWNMSSSGTPSYHVGFENYGSILPDISTGDPVLFFSYSTSVPFQGFVGDKIAIDYRLRALSAGTTRVNFSNTGTFSIEFDDPEVRAVAPPTPDPPPIGPLVLTRNGDRLVLTWEAGPEIRLQQSTDLDESAWSDVEGTLGLGATQLDLAQGRRFFRLYQP